MKRVRESGSLDFVMSPVSASPMYRQLCEFLRQDIVNGSLPPGYNLPSTRSLAHRLRVSRNTVLNAYEELAAEGLIEGRIGAGTRVCGAGPMCVPKIPDVKTLLHEAHYPGAVSHFYDPDGSPLYLHR